MKSSYKVTLFITFTFLIILTVFGFTIYYVLNNYSYVDFYKRLETRLSIATRYHFETDSTDAEKLKLLKSQHLETLEQEKEYVIDLSVQDPAELKKSYNFPERFSNQLMKDKKARFQSGSFFYVGKIYSHNQNEYMIVVSAVNYYVSHHMIFLRNVLIAGIFFFALITVSLSYYFSRNIFSPIREIISKVKQISTESIHLRLKGNSSNAEVNELVVTFNDLLNRIETAFETQKNFVSNASHELGTPLTSIIGEADVALLKSRSIEEYQESLKKILVQAERLDQITKSLLFLAQTGYKGKATGFEVVRLDQIIWDTKGIIDRLNPENKVVIDLSMLPEDPKRLKVKANKQLLQLAFANILNNACKYSNNKEVEVFIAATENNIIVTIKDYGIGIPKNEIEFIYDPFFRASNTTLFAGYGIGLPLSRNVIHLHKGVLQVDSEQNAGTTVVVKLPIHQFV